MNFCKTQKYISIKMILVKRITQNAGPLKALTTPLQDKLQEPLQVVAQLYMLQQVSCNPQ
jgi:hypothetical protein